MPTVTFKDIAPPSRSNGIAWVAVNVYYADTESGPFSIIDQLHLSPLDVDPEHPMARTFMTSKAPADSGWFELEFIDNSADSEKLPVIYIEAEPVSEIAKLVRSYIPESYRALVNDDDYGQEMVNLRIEAARYEVLPAALANADESTYSPLMKDYVACTAALQLIPAARDYWMRQKISLSSGSQENLTLPDPIQALKDQETNLMRRLANLSANPAIVALGSQSLDYPQVSSTGDFITTDPFEWPPAFETGTTTPSEV